LEECKNNSKQKVGSVKKGSEAVQRGFFEGFEKNNILKKQQNQGKVYIVSNTLLPRLAETTREFGDFITIIIIHCTGEAAAGRYFCCSKSTAKSSE